MSLATGIPAFVALLTLAILWASHKRGKSPLPPGPTADPFIGHLRLMPRENQAETFHEWSKTYGNLIYLKVFGRDMVVIGSFGVAQELLENRSAKYSCRPPFIVWKMMGWWPTLTFLPYGKRFLKHRKMFQQYFGHKESLAFNDVLAEEARLLVTNLQHAAPGEHLHYVHRYTISNIMRAAFGKQIKSDGDPFIKLASDVSSVLNNSGPMGNTPVDMFPWLRHLPTWFPGTYYASYALANSKIIRRLHDDPFAYVQQQMRNRNVQRSFLSEMLNELGDNDDPEHFEDIKGASATVFAAGEDTTFLTLNRFFLFMVLHPEYQKRAYEEIISVIGEDRLPEYSDRESLPFVECIMQEALRFYPAAPLGIPHRSLEDDFYNGMFIPKGTIMIANVYGMSQDENVYSNPKVFDPTRFLPAPEGKGEPHFAAAWGFGRRICPGRHFASLSLWHAMAYVLTTLEIRPAKDENGKVVLPEVKFTEGLTSQAAPYTFEVRPRSEAARALIAHIEV
uniref:Putative cytochrome P450 n=1 Tax=Moniliophthora roreri TaxID=221103 RepID=A0A0W0EW71_MONRR